MTGRLRRPAQQTAHELPTPAWAITRLFDLWSPPRPPKGQRRRWLDVGAGSGAIIRGVNRLYREIEWTAIDARSECRRGLERLGAKFVHDDFARWAYGVPRDQRTWDVVITHPSGSPYGLAEEAIVRWALRLAPIAITLFPITFLCVKRRRGYLDARRPDIYVLPEPVYVTPRYHQPMAWYVWSIASRGRWRMLPNTPKAERVAEGREPSYVGLTAGRHARP